MNLQSKHVIAGTVIGRGQVALTVATPRPMPAADTPESTSAPVKLSSVGPNAE